MGFLDDLTSTINRGTAGAERGMRKLQLSSQLADLQKKREGFLLSLGEALYEQTRSDPAFTADHQQLYSDIALMDEKISALELAISQIDATAAAAPSKSTVTRHTGQRTVCLNCGATIMVTDAFCSSCGTATATAPRPEDDASAGDAAGKAAGNADDAEKAAPQPVACPKCGTVSNERAVFCLKCGTKLTQ